MRGVAVQTVVFLVLAVVALIIVFFFLSKAVPFISQFVDSIVRGMTRSICEQIPLINMLC